MNKYNNSKIYKIIDDSNNNVYYGSTIEKYISNRLGGHKKLYKRYINNKTKYKSTSCEIIKNNNYHIELVEEVNCNNKFQLLERERYYIENFDCINKNIPNRGKKEYRDNNKKKIKESQKNYYINNKKKKNESTKKYYNNNKERIKNNYNNNKERIKENKKNYYINNKEMIKERIKNNYQYNKAIKELYNINLSIFI